MTNNTYRAIDDPAEAALVSKRLALSFNNGPWLKVKSIGPVVANGDGTASMSITAAWPDNTKLPHPTKAAAIKHLCQQAREAQPLPAVWPERVANKQAVTQ